MRHPRVARVGKRFAVILGVLILVPVVLFASLWLYTSVAFSSSKIVDFHPSYFQAKADANFFYSIGDELKYSDDYDRAVLPAKGLDLVVGPGGAPQQLEIRGKSYLALTLGETSKGAYYCSDRLRSVFLPGDRYFLFNVPYCGNYKGQLLIDTLTGKYQRLPKDSRVYLTLNTDTYPHYRVTGGGMMAK
jgi:hypothetical protein